MEFLILGSLEVLGRDGPIALGGPKRRGLLALLLVKRGQVVAADRIAEDLREGDAAQNLGTVHTYVSQLRKLLVGGDGVVLTTRGGGYVLDLPDSALDAARFEVTARAAAAEADLGRRVELCDAALGLWRGTPLEEFSWLWATAERARLEGLRVETLSRRLDARLERGEHYEVLGELERLTGEYPLDERLWAQRMLACYRAGRQSDALRAFGQARRHLSEELGVEPSPDLVALEHRILDHDPTLAAPTPPALTARDENKPAFPVGVATFLLSDIEGSTELWDRHPEAMAVALAHHEALIAETVEAHAGYVVKSRGEGDSTLSVFVSPSDAAAAAVALQRALRDATWPNELSLATRLAIHTGEAQLRDGDYYGGTLNRAARIRALAGGGEILCSRTTAELIADTLPPDLRLTELGTHDLKGLRRSETVHALVAIDETSPPRLRSLRSTHNLPHELTSFIGRHRELAELRKLVADSRLVTLVGAGGCGKTRLARRLGAELSDGLGDGVWLVELASVSDPARVASTVASVLGVADEPGHSPLERLIDALIDRTTLILLDNCEHVLDAAATVVQALLEYCPGVDVLATSREALGVPGEHIYRVPSLAVPPPGVSVDELPQFEAVRLFADRAAQHVTGFAVTRDNAASVASICRRLDGIPLALELAASALRSLSTVEMATRLVERFRLGTHGGRLAPPRHQTLRAMVDWSHELLSERERLVFARLSVFSGGWMLDAAEAVAADGVTVALHDVPGIVSALVDKSLVEADLATDTTRYRFLETIREFAAEQLADRGDDERMATRRRHRDYFLTMAETAAPELHAFGQLEWLDRLELEHDNIRSALDSIDADPSDEATDAGLRILAAIAWFWVIRGHSLEASERADRMLARPHPPAAARTRAAGLLAAAELDEVWDNDQRAQGRLHEALALARGHDDAYVTSGVLASLAFWAFQSSPLDLAPARQLGEEALHVARAAGHPHRVGRALMTLGMIVGAQGDYDSARELLGEAVALFRMLGDREWISNTYNTLGVLLINHGDLVEARVVLEEARVAVLAIRSSPYFAEQNLATIALLEGDADTADRMFTECLREARREGYRVGTAYAYLGCALSATMRGDFHRAAVLHGVADLVTEQVSRPYEDLEAGLRTADLQTLHRALGDAAWQQGYEHGRQLSTAEAAAMVLAPRTEA